MRICASFAPRQRAKVLRHTRYIYFFQTPKGHAGLVPPPQKTFFCAGFSAKLSSGDPLARV
jgi:hypothetical protein